MGAMGVEDDPTLHYASSKAKAEALVAASGLDWTILKPSLQFGQGDGFFNILADLVRLSPGLRPGAGERREPVPADPRRRRRPGGRRVVRRPDHGRRGLRAGRAALLDVPGDRPRGPVGHGQAPRHRPDAGAPHPLVAGAAETVRIPFPVATDQLRQLRLDNIGPLGRRSRRGSGSSRGPMAARLGYLRAKARDQRTRGDVLADGATAASLAVGDGVAPA